MVAYARASAARAAWLRAGEREDWTLGETGATYEAYRAECVTVFHSLARYLEPTDPVQFDQDTRSWWDSLADGWTDPPSPFAEDARPDHG